MKSKNQLPPLVLIEWVDSKQPEPAWRHLDDLPELTVIECASVGWLIGESKGVKMLAPNIGDIKTEGNTQASGFIRIPSRSITRQVMLREAK